MAQQSHCFTWHYNASVIWCDNNYQSILFAQKKRGKCKRRARPADRPSITRILCFRINLNSEKHSLGKFVILDLSKNYAFRSHDGKKGLAILNKTTFFFLSFSLGLSTRGSFPFIWSGFIQYNGPIYFWARTKALFWLPAETYCDS